MYTIAPGAARECGRRLAAEVERGRRRLRASTGGIEYAEPLGWDRIDRKAFFLIQSVDESNRGPFVVYLKTDGRSTGRPVQVEWSKGGGPEDSLFVSRLETPGRRLQPLVDFPGQTVFHYTKLIGKDSIAAMGGGVTFDRYRIRVSDPNIADEEFEVTTICEPVVQMIRRYRWERRDPMFGILSFRGIPDELGYETQVPVYLPLLSPREPTRTPTKIEWIRWK